MIKNVLSSVIRGVISNVIGGGGGGNSGPLPLDLIWYSDGDGTGGTRDNSIPEGAFVVSFEDDSPTQGNSVTITTDGTYSFGSAGPINLLINTYLGLTDGVDVPVLSYSGLCSVTQSLYGSPVVTSAANLPNGKGVIVGAEGAAPQLMEYSCGGVSDSEPVSGQFNISVDSLSILISKTDENSVDRTSAFIDAFQLTVREIVGQTSPQISEVITSIVDSGAYYTLNLASVVNNPAAIPFGSSCYFVLNIDGLQFKKIDAVFDDTYKNTYCYQVVTYPDDNQANADVFSVKGIGQRAGVKSMWLMESNDGDNADHIDMFAGTTSGYVDSFDRWLGTTLSLSSNGLNSVNATFEADENITTTLISPPIAQQQREQYIVEKYDYLGSEYGAKDGLLDYRLIDTERGIFCNNIGVTADYDLKTLTPPADVADKFFVDRVKFPAFVRGMSRLGDCYAISSHTYITGGIGAKCGVWVADAADRSTAKKITPFTVSSWSDNSVVASVEEGFFYGTDLNSRYLWVTNAAGDIVNSMLIGDR